MGEHDFLGVESLVPERKNVSQEQASWTTKTNTFASALESIQWCSFNIKVILAIHVTLIVY